MRGGSGSSSSLGSLGGPGRGGTFYFQSFGLSKKHLSRLTTALEIKQLGMQLYVTQKGQQAGPFPIETVKGMLERKELTPTDLVWHEGAPGWMPLSSFMAVQQVSGPVVQAPPVQPAAARPVHVPHSDAVIRALAGIKGLEGMTLADIQAEVQRGGVFVRYQYCISVLVMTFKRSSGIHFIKSGHSRVSPGALYTTISLICGWWGIPWGPIWTITTVSTNFGGGKDITAAVIGALGQRRA